LEGKRQGASVVKEALEKCAEMIGFRQMTLVDLFNEVVKKHPVAIRYIKGSWIDVIR
jgi:phosphoenolpyruvate phosphomutase